ncbi:hypothetical protein LOC68_21830 [Blastopirellula sp. JC732]|uniref:RNA ligase domain-containing protein n=1 Tax=Blastopirellula sediminis TaxID=2894196 RepID=A0A9X1MRG9_9BACT|nr:RNA ligase family protein [Blastopirellula sediminis]MCC9605660.1 hypothetical protein [Blastopirellula sediminis]MCC9631040.1 hypothetical protein [Blastopirellula sediminis]
MLHYPKIPGSKNAPLQRCIAFEKYDGANLHWDWDRDFGWHAFGTRRDAFNLTDEGIAQFCERHAHLHECVSVFWRSLAEPLEKIFRDHADYRNVQSFQAFTEFLGPNSFAGLHQEADPKELRLFDVSLESTGLIAPGRFVTDFAALPIARVVYQGRLTGRFAEDVREGKYGVDEGVICKGGGEGTDLWMVKIKTYAYLQKLKQAFADRWEEYWE